MYVVVSCQLLVEPPMTTRTPRRVPGVWCLLAPFWGQYSGLPPNPWPQRQMYKNSAFFFHFCSAMICTLKLVDWVLLFKHKTLP